MSPFVVSIDKVFPNPWNMNRMSDFMFRQLVNNLRDIKAPVPILVRPHPKKKGCFQIVDGEHRWKAYKVLGRTKIRIVCEDLTDAQARTLTINLNYLRGSADPQRLDRVVSSIVRELGEKKAKALLPYTPIEVEDMTKVAREMHEEVRERLEECRKRQSLRRSSEAAILMLEMGPYTPTEFKEIRGILSPSKTETESRKLLRLLREGRDSSGRMESAQSPALRKRKSVSES